CFRRAGSSRGRAVSPVYANSVGETSINRRSAFFTEGDDGSDFHEALAATAHELKTPLAIMGGYLQLLLTEKLGPLTSKQVEVLTEIQENGLRLSNCVQNLLAYASMKLERCKMQCELADINACICEIAQLWSPRFHDKAIAFYFFPAAKLGAFRFDWFK